MADTPYMYADGDVNAGRMPVITGVAYTNSDNDPMTATTLYGIDPARVSLALISSPNGGFISTVGGLGLGFMTSVTGFDIFFSGGENQAFLSAFTSATTPISTFYRVNLATGAATSVGNIGAAGGLQGIAVTATVSAVPEPGTWALLATGLVGLAAFTRRGRAKA